MQRVLIIGASGAIGAALGAAAAERGADVTLLSRRDDGLDVTDEASVAAALGALQPAFDTVIVATGALTLNGQGPEKSLRGLTPQALTQQFALNAMGPALVLKHALRLMPRDRPARFAALSARVGSIGDNGLGGWYSYRAAKAALNQLIHTAAVEVARSHPHAVVVTLHPGTVETPLTEGYRGAHAAVPPATAAEMILDVLTALTLAQTGGFYDQNGLAIPW
jgi:NAD(P)-dependent dehydrogenase (short-subunit alcohol dehydrogenase family)